MALKTVLITGCSSGGVGAALALAFQQREFHVFATARTPSKIDAALTKLPNVEVLALDVTDAAQISHVVEDVTAKTNAQLDVLINNAGANYTMPVLDASLEDGKKLFDANFWGMIAMCQAFAPLLVRAKGTVVNMSSIAGELNTPWMGRVEPFHYEIRVRAETLL